MGSTTRSWVAPPMRLPPTPPHYRAPLCFHSAADVGMCGVTRPCSNGKCSRSKTKQLSRIQLMTLIRGCVMCRPANGENKGQVCDGSK